MTGSAQLPGNFFTSVRDAEEDKEEEGVKVCAQLQPENKPESPMQIDSKTKEGKSSTPLRAEAGEQKVLQLNKGSNKFNSFTYGPEAHPFILLVAKKVNERMKIIHTLDNQ